MASSAQVGKRLHLCTVGKKPSAATCYLNDPDEVLELLATIGKWKPSVRANRFSLNDLSTLHYGNMVHSPKDTSPGGSALVSDSSPHAAGVSATEPRDAQATPSAGSSTKAVPDETAATSDVTALGPMLTPLSEAGSSLGARSFSTTHLSQMNQTSLPRSASTTLQQFMENIAEEEEEDEEGGIFF